MRQSLGGAYCSQAPSQLCADDLDLETWTTALAKGELSKEEFEWLLKGQKDLAEMVALKKAGLGNVRVDQFRSSLIDLVIGSAFKVFL